MWTTLNEIREHYPCTEGWKKLLRHLGKAQPDDEPLSIVTVLESNGLDDALWALRAVKGYDKEIRLYAVWCARQVQHLMTDKRSVEALDVAERFANGEASEDELAAAGYAAWAAAEEDARAAAENAARAAAEYELAAAEYELAAAEEDARAAAEYELAAAEYELAAAEYELAAAENAARVAAAFSARAAANAARAVANAAWAAAGYAARAAQEQKLREICEVCK